MKQIILMSCLTICLATGFSQKIYQTRSGNISFFSNAPIENIEAANNEVSTKLSTNGQVIFLVAIRSFVFKNSLMQEHINEDYMESDKYPKATFFGNITNINEVNFAKDGIYNVIVNGDLEIHGVKKKIQAPAVLEIKDGKLTAKTSFELAIKDYGITGSYIGSKIANDIKITLNCIYE